jgi:hypothetical protein
LDPRLGIIEKKLAQRGMNHACEQLTEGKKCKRLSNKMMHKLIHNKRNGNSNYTANPFFTYQIGKNP